jgi:diamine N-acetyltransferase
MSDDSAPEQVPAEIRALTAGSARKLASRMARIDPWTRLGIGEDALFDALVPNAQGGVIAYDAHRAGIVLGGISYRASWLYGPYIRLLAVLPEAQNERIGRSLVTRVADDAKRRGAQNVWVCASAFNTRAIAFYERIGFTRIGRIDDLIVSGEDEVLLRLRLDHVSEP